MTQLASPTQEGHERPNAIELKTKLYHWGTPIERSVSRYVHMGDSREYVSQSQAITALLVAIIKTKDNDASLSRVKNGDKKLIKLDVTDKAHCSLTGIEIGRKTVYEAIGIPDEMGHLISLVNRINAYREAPQLIRQEMMNSFREHKGTPEAHPWNTSATIVAHIFLEYDLLQNKDFRKTAYLCLYSVTHLPLDKSGTPDIARVLAIIASMKTKVVDSFLKAWNNPRY